APVRAQAPAGTQAPAEAESEVTMQVRLPVVPEFADAPGTDAPDPYAIGPDRHERAADEVPEPHPAAPAATPAADALPGPRQPEQPAERITDKGLPKRTPKVTKPAAAPTAERRGSLDKEALRRRLGGFHQGAKDGRRDVEAEIAETTATRALPGAAAQTEHSGAAGLDGGRTDRTDETGDTVEEARS
ncbi:histidine kinase, partial [Streptomyces sp. CLV115]